MAQGHLPDGINEGLVFNRIVRLHNLLEIDLVAIIEARIDFHGVLEQTCIGLDADALANAVHQALADRIEISIGEQRVCKLGAVLGL